MSAETMKMPEPIIDPTTTMVESNSPSPRLNSVSRVIADGTVDGNSVVFANGHS
jgi:hypothetical protein